MLILLFDTSHIVAINYEFSAPTAHKLICRKNTVISNKCAENEQRKNEHTEKQPRF